MNILESQFSRTAEIGVVAGFVSLFVFDAYWVMNGWSMVLNLSSLQIEDTLKVTSGISFWGPQIGLNSRLIGAAIALIALSLFWLGDRPFSKIKSLLATTLVLESVYIVSFLAIARFLFRPSDLFGNTTQLSPFFFLTFNYLLQIVIAVPFLLILALKVYTYKGGIRQKLSLQKWAGIAFVGYVAALAINSVFRWLDMLWSQGLVFLLTGVRALGFLNSAIFMPLGIVFAAIGACTLGRQKVASALRWFGLALISVGLSYTIYVVYSYWVGALKFAMLVDVWTVPLLGLGVALFINSRKNGIQG